MAGRGPAPKADRVRRNKETAPVTTIHAQAAKQPTLPTRMPGGDAWPPQTRAWWRTWGRSPLTRNWLETDWQELRDTAVLHGAYWSGNLAVAPELRRRTARHGATTEDRARQRMVVAASVSAPTGPAAPQASSARERRQHLASVPS